MSVYRRDYAKEIDPNEGSVGVWAYAFVYRKYRYRKSGFRTKREAELSEAKAREEAMFHGKLPTTGGDIGFTALVDQFFLSRHLIRAPRTVAGELRKAETLKKFFGNSPLSRIGIGAVEAFRDLRLRAGKMPRTINLELILLRVMFKYAIDHNYAQVNPARSVKDLKVLKTDKPIPTEAELQRLLTEAEKTYSGRQLVYWIWLSAFTGLRSSESCFLEWKDIDFQQGLLYVRPKPGNPLKNGKWRVVNVHPHLLTILGHWKTEWEQVFAKRGKGKEHDWMFFHPRKPANRCDTFRKAFEHACRSAELHGITLHSMRHFFISKAVMSGVEMFTIAKWAGHSSTKMIEEVYGHLSPDYRREQMAKFQIGIPPPLAPAPVDEKKSA